MIDVSMLVQHTPVREAPDPSLRRSLGLTAVVTLVVWGGCIALGWTSGLQLPIAAQDQSHQPWQEILPIFLTNLAVALGLVSGAVTLGVSTLAVGAMVALYTGSVVQAAVAAWGPAGAASGLLPFFAFELAGLLAASLAGVLPVVHAVRYARPPGRLLPDPRRAGHLYLAAMRLSLLCCVIAALLLGLGAVLEVAGGMPR